MTSESRLVGVSESGRLVGEYCPRAKLSDHDIHLIHELHEAGLGYRRLAAKFEVSRSLIRYILKGMRRTAWVAEFRRVHESVPE